MKQLLIVAGIVAAIAAGVGYYFTHNGKAAIPEYRAEKADIGPIKDKVSATGRVHPTEQEIVGSDTVGRVAEIFQGIEIGAMVSQGQPLLKLDDELANALLKAAKSDLIAAKGGVQEAEAARDLALLAKQQAESAHDDAVQELKRREDLAAGERSNISKNALEAARALVNRAKDQISVAEAQMKRADAGFAAAQSKRLAAEAKVQAQQLAVDMTLIKSPVAGTIVDKRVIKGQVLSPQTSPVLFIIVPDLNKMQVEAQVGESDILKVREGMNVQFTVDAAADSGEVFHGKVNKISPIPIITQARIPQLGETAGALSGPVYYKVSIDVIPRVQESGAKHEGGKPPKPGPSLRIGLNASVDIILRKEEKVRRVPAASLNFQPNDVTPEEQKKIADGVARNLKPLWVLEGAGQRRLVLVQTGATEGNRTEILKAEGDLKEGMDLIIEGPPPEKPGGIFETKTNIRI